MPMNTDTDDNWTDEKDEDYSDYLEEISGELRTANDRKGLGALYILDICKKYGDGNKHPTNAEIRKILSDYPYDLGLERQAVARTLGLLRNEGLIPCDRTAAGHSDTTEKYKTANSRKSLGLLYIYKVILKHSDDGNHLKNEEIRKMLENPPYDLKLERKAVSRNIGLLHNEGFIFNDRTGSWCTENYPYNRYL